MQKRTSSWPYRLTYAPFRFLEDPSVQPFHMNADSPNPAVIDELHYHDGLELGLCLDGSGVFIIDGEPIPFSAPCVTILYPGQYHKARSGLLPSRWYFATFCPELLLPALGAKTSRELFNPKSVPPELSLFGPDTVPYRLISQIIQEMRDRPPLFLECIRGLLQALIIAHSRMLDQSDAAPRRDRRSRRPRPTPWWPTSASTSGRSSPSRKSPGSSTSPRPPSAAGSGTPWRPPLWTTSTGCGCRRPAPSSAAASCRSWIRPWP